MSVIFDACTEKECQYTELFDMEPAMWVPLQFILDGPPFIAERLSRDVVKALQKGVTRVFIDSPSTLSELGLIRRETALSRTDEDKTYIIKERMCRGRWVKYFCSCPGFNYHGHCKHSLAEDRYGE